MCAGLDGHTVLGLRSWKRRDPRRLSFSPSSTWWSAHRLHSAGQTRPEESYLSSLRPLDLRTMQAPHPSSMTDGMCYTRLCSTWLGVSRTKNRPDRCLQPAAPPIGIGKPSLAITSSASRDPLDSEHLTATAHLLATALATIGSLPLIMTSTPLFTTPSGAHDSRDSRHLVENPPL
jgi:hypothetical protein